MCKFYNLLYRLLPVRRIQAWVIDRHFSRCPLCGLNEKEGIRLDGLVRRAFAPHKSDSLLWPGVRSRMDKIRFVGPSHRFPLKSFRFPAWRWAAAGLALLFILGLNQLVFHPPEHSGPAADGQHSRVKINYAKIKGKNAKTHVYQTSQRSYILFLETDKNGG
ncbi:MAG: hypothetical protein KKD59_04570 [Acidobacteria bacterium]|nr:hypothetical protein [Acidobacteriota bacterium]